MIDATCEAYSDCIDLVVQIVDERKDSRAMENLMNYYDVVTKQLGSSRNMRGISYRDHQEKKWCCVYGLMSDLFYKERKPFFESKPELSGD